MDIKQNDVPNHLRQLGFDTVGQSTRKKVSTYMELCYYHQLKQLFLQTIESGYSIKMVWESIQDVEAIIKFCENHLP